MNVSKPEHISDHKLVEEISNGCEMSFAHFYNRHWDSLFISAFKVLKDEEACKDVVQEVFLSIWRNDNLINIENVEGYLHRSVRYKVLMTLRKAKLSEKHLETIQILSENTTEKQLDFEELSETVEQSINSLPDRCQEVFRLSRMENLSNREIAERLNISVRTVETHIGHAIRKVKANLDSSTVFITVGLIISSFVITVLT